MCLSSPGAQCGPCERAWLPWPDAIGDFCSLFYWSNSIRPKLLPISLELWGEGEGGKQCMLGARGQCCSFSQKGKCTGIHSPRTNSRKQPTNLYQVGDRLFFSRNHHFYSRKKHVKVCTLMVSISKGAILPAEMQYLYVASD